MDWMSSVDLRATLATCHKDLLGDWYRDPWGWPELDWLATEGTRLLEERLNGRGSRRVSLVDVPKENFATRPAMVLDPVDRFAYQALVGQLSKSIIGDLDYNVYGWRLPRGVSRPGRYSPNDLQWKLYRFQLRFLTGLFDVALKTDIVSCFASISVSLLTEDLEERITRRKDRPLVDRLFSFLEQWERVPGRSGIPQRCQASSVLANMLLSKLDDVLLFHARPVLAGDKRRRSYARWMDDMWLFGDDPGELRRAQVSLEEGMREIGLHMNNGKTKLLEGSEVAEYALHVEHSAVDGALNANPSDPQPLDDLIEGIIFEREEANRTSIKFATDRMRRTHHFAKLDDLWQIAHRLPHGADALARLSRDAKRALALQDWYLDYCETPWASVEWPVAQFGTMFPSSSESVDKSLKEYFSEALTDNRATLPMIALAAQRLATWDKALARVVIQEAVKKSSNPIERRVLALAGLNAGCTKSSVRRWLGEFEENVVTVEMLEDRSFRPISFKPDFAALP